MTPEEDVDLGEPVAELRDLSIEVDERFGPRLRRRIERRRLAGDLIGLAWTAPFAVLLELLRGPLEWLAGKRRA